jgi:hypothetical protein
VVTAQVDGFADGLEPDGLLAQAGDRQRSRDASGRDDDVVVLDLARRADDRGHDCRPAAVLDPDHLAGEHLTALELAPQRDDCVPRRDAAGRRLRQERLVRHVRLGIDDDHLGLTGVELLG